MALSCMRASFDQHLMHISASTHVGTKRRQRPARKAAGLPQAQLLLGIWLLLGWSAHAASHPLPGRSLLAPAQQVPVTAAGAADYFCNPDGARCCQPARAACPACKGAAAVPSALWGCKGELFSPSSRLLDWSYAGFGGGADIPALAVTGDMRADFGAVGDGVTDDTQAFLDALTAVRDRAVLHVPAGAYVITKVLDIKRRVVFVGDGPEATVLLFPKPLSQVLGYGASNSRQSSFTYGGAFINWWGGDRLDSSNLLTSVTQPAGKGDHVLVVSNTAGMAAGDTVRLTQDNPPDGSLARDLNGGYYDTSSQNANSGKAQLVKFRSRIASVGVDSIKLERPLPWNVSLAWQPTLYAGTSPGRSLCGVESLTIRFPWTSHNGFGNEAGYNALNFWNTIHSVVKDVVIVNADTGIIVENSTFITISDLNLTTSKDGAAGYSNRGEFDGAFGLRLKGVDDSLVTKFNINAKFVHDIALTPMSTGVVLSNGAAQDLGLRLQYDGPYGTLVSNVDFGQGTRAWEANSSPRAAAYTTLWNVRSSKAGNSTPYLPANYGALINIIGAAISGSSSTPYSASSCASSPYECFLESEGPVVPADLHAAMASGKTPGQLMLPAELVGTGKEALTAADSAAAHGLGVLYSCDANTGKICCPSFLTPARAKTLGPPHTVAAALAGVARALSRDGSTTASSLTITSDSAAATAGSVEALLADCPVCSSNKRQSTPSRLFGCEGELWAPSGRLSYDWSFAGYGAGNGSAIPSPEERMVDTNVASWGAVGDNVTDDTAAFNKALAETPAGGVLYVPAGVYRITSNVSVYNKAVVIRGAGKDKTILYFPFSYTDLYGNDYQEGPSKETSQYSHGVGMLNIWGWDNTHVEWLGLCTVVQDAVRGDTLLWVDNAAKVKQGQWVRLIVDNDGADTQIDNMNADDVEPGPAQANTKQVVRFLSRVAFAGSNWLLLERPLPVNISASWLVPMLGYAPAVQNAGVESLTVMFPVTTYPGHLKELGYNGIHLNQAAHSWVKDVRVLNGDMAVYLWGCTFCTVSGLEVGVTGDRGYISGHRGVWLEHGSDNLVENLNITVRMVHDVTVAAYEMGSVVKNSVGLDLNLDHHRATPYSNLFTNLDMGFGGRALESSGDGVYGPHSGAFSTFWNLKGRLAFYAPDNSFGPLLNFVGVRASGSLNAPTWYSEQVSSKTLAPADLHEAMVVTRQFRLASLVPAALPGNASVDGYVANSKFNSAGYGRRAQQSRALLLQFAALALATFVGLAIA